MNGRHSVADETDKPRALNAAVRRARRTGDTAFLVATLPDEIEGPLAAKYLGDMGDTSVGPALLPLLDSANPHARAPAARSLGQLNVAAAVPRLTELAEHDEVPWVRSWATQSLALISGSQSSAVLIGRLDDRDWRVRAVAVRGLHNFGDEQAVSELQSAKRRERWYRRRVYAKAIRQILRRQT
jgi:HEAT repeat protein